MVVGASRLKDYHETIHHFLDCAMTLIPINEADTVIAMFVSEHRRKFVDTHSLILSHGASIGTSNNEYSTTEPLDPGVNKQSQLVPADSVAAPQYVFPTDNIICVTIDGIISLLVIVREKILQGGNEEFMAKGRSNLANKQQEIRTNSEFLKFLKNAK